MSVPEAFARLDRRIEQQMRAENIPGMAVALTDREHLLRLSTYGFADIAARAPVTADTLFPIGSIGKSFTSVAVLQQHELGRLDLHAPVSRYLPWFHVPSAYGPITLYDLLTHTAGITRGWEFAAGSRYQVWALRETEATSPPGARYSYSNAGYEALGFLLEDVLGRRYGEIVQGGILDPLGMAATHPAITHETRKQLATGYVPFYDDRPEAASDRLVPATWLETNTGDGCLAAPVGDLAAYLRMLLRHGQGPGGPLLAAESFSAMVRPAVECWPGTSYGYGLMMTEIEGHTCFGHSGLFGGYASTMVGDLDEGTGIVVLANRRADPFDIALFGLGVLRAVLHGREPPEMPPTKSRTRVQDGVGYAGTYWAGARALTIMSEDESLILDHGDERIVLEPQGQDQFYARHPDFTLFLLRFGRAHDQVVELFHGPDWYPNERYTGPAAFAVPHEWVAYTGHYRSYKPWSSNFRVVLRKDTLVFVDPWDFEETLVPLGDGIFRIGEDEQGPERIRFDTVVDGQALKANVSGADYYRVFTL